MLLQCIFRNVILPQHDNSGLCPDTIFAFLTAQNCELNASKISLCVQLIVLSSSRYIAHTQLVTWITALLYNFSR